MGLGSGFADHETLLQNSADGVAVLLVSRRPSDSPGIAFDYTPQKTPNQKVLTLTPKTLINCSVAALNS